MFKHIIDDEVELKLLEIKDAEEIYKLMDSCREYLREWLPWIDSSTSPEATKEFIRSTLKQYSENNGFHTCILYKGKIAGIIGFHGVNWANKSTSIGYWLGEQYNGKGIMTKACRSLVNYAFEDIKLNRVEIRCAEQNFKSRAIPVRLGFKSEGVVRESEWLYDHYVSHVVYGILEKEWNK